MGLACHNIISKNSCSVLSFITGMALDAHLIGQWDTMDFETGLVTMELGFTTYFKDIIPEPSYIDQMRHVQKILKRLQPNEMETYMVIFINMLAGIYSTQK